MPFVIISPKNKVGSTINPLVSPQELLALQCRFSQCSNYYETGIGGSTLLAQQYDNIKSITAVEADKSWCEIVQNKTKKQNTDIVCIHYSHGDWCTPTDANQKNIWENYSSYIQTTPITYDLVFVDGRFRTACAAAAYGKLEDAGYLMVHDYLPEKRNSYARILDVYDLHLVVDSLAIFTKKPGCLDKAQQLWEEHKHIAQ